MGPLKHHKCINWGNGEPERGEVAAFWDTGKMGGVEGRR